METAIPVHKLTIAEARVLQDTTNPVIHWRPEANIPASGSQRCLGHLKLVPMQDVPEALNYAVEVPIEALTTPAVS